MNDIISVVNTLAQNLYSTIEQEVFTVLDDLLVIRKDILEIEPLEKLGFENDNNSIFLLSLCFTLVATICFVIKRLISMYTATNDVSTVQFVLKTLVCTILSASSWFICETLLDVNGLFSEVVQSIGVEIAKDDISFEGLKEVISSLPKSDNFLSLDGAIKGMVGFGAVSLLFTFCIRYVTVIFLIIVATIAFMLAIDKSTFGIFAKWCRLILTNLFLQNIALIIIIIPLSIEQTNTIIFKVILVGSIYMLYKINNFAGELLSGILFRRSE